MDDRRTFAVEVECGDSEAVAVGGYHVELAVLTELAKMVSEAWSESFAGFRQEPDSIDDAVKDTQYRLSNIYDAIETGKVGLADLALRIKELRIRQERRNRASVRRTPLWDPGSERYRRVC